MIKQVYVFQPSIPLVEAFRWYFRYHGKEAVRYLGPWMRRYETYRSFDAPVEADRFGVLRGGLTEVWYSNFDDWKEAMSQRMTYTPGVREVFGGRGSVPMAATMIPALPTEDFLGKLPLPEERPILRWYQIFKYPAGVSVADGEAWYLRHAEEVKNQPGLLRFVSHRVPADAPYRSPWHRVSELWYEDFAAWREAVMGVDDYTPPPWGGTYPFVDMTSTFVGYKADVDYLKDNPTIP